MACIEQINVSRMALGMLAEPFTLFQGRPLTLVRLAEEAACAGRFRAFAFVMRHDGLQGR